MLDDAERSALAETERALLDEDPGLARRMRRGSGLYRPRYRIALVIVASALVVGLVMLGLPGQAVLVILLVAWYLRASGWRPGRRHRRRSAASRTDVDRAE